MALDWSKLAPQMPAGRDGLPYVPRPGRGAERLAAWIMAGANPIAIVGAMGSGKSSESVAAAVQLRDRASMAAGALDHVDVPGALNPDGVQLVLAGALANFMVTKGHVLSGELQQQGVNLGWGKELGAGEMKPLPTKLPPADVLRSALREAKKAFPERQVIALCDGLGKLPADKARDIVDALLPFRSDATLVLVLPLSLVTGPASYDVVSTFKLFAVRPVPVAADMPSFRDGRAFLRTMALVRLGLDPALPQTLDPALDRAAEASGGVPRAFLQLVQDAGMYATLAGREIPDDTDVQDAMADHAASLRRLLDKGDVAALREADGTDGLEVEAARKLRFFAHGLLLEYDAGEGTIVRPSPLLRGVLAQGKAA